jgi:RNA polymerase sigma factor (sigma-70 family)
MNRFFTIKPKETRRLLKAAKPVITVFSAISNLQKKIAEKEKIIKSGKAKPEEIKELKTELKKKEKEIKKMGKKQIAEGSEAIRFLIYRNQNFVKYLARGYHSYGGKIDPDELASEGMTSLLKAIEKFDMNSVGTLQTYAGFWIRQYIQSFINKNRFINQSSVNKEKKNVIFYDSNYQNQDEQSKSYSLVDTLDDSENLKVDNEEVRQRETSIQVNDLINSLENREKILLIRLSHQIVPSNLLDIYCIAEKEEQGELKKVTKLGRGKNLNILKSYSLKEKVFGNLPIVKKYLMMFTKDYKLSGLTKLLNKSENSIRRLKKESFKQLQDLTKERKLHLLLE